MYYQVGYEYDEAGNIASERYYDADGEPMARGDGAFSVGYTYDADGKRQETIRYDADGNRID